MEKKAKKTTIKVKALVPLARVGLAYSEGNEFELDSKVAKELIQDGLVEKCGK